MGAAMRVCYSIVVGTVLIAALIQLWGAAPLDIVGEDASPKEEVAWYIATWRHAWSVMGDDYRHEAAGRIARKMEASPEVYYPLVEDALWKSQDLYAEVAALHTLARPFFVERKRDRILEILKMYVTGEYESSHNEQTDFSAVGEAAGFYPLVAGADDARDLLPLIRLADTRTAQIALESVAELGDLSIIPEVKAAAGDRFHSQYIQEQIIGPIRKRRAQAEAKLQGEAAARDGGMLSGFRSQALSDYRRLADADVVVIGRVASTDLTAERALAGTPFATPLIRIDLDPTEVGKGEAGRGLLSLSCERIYMEQMLPIIKGRFALVFLRRTENGFVPLLGRRGEIVGSKEDAKEFNLVRSLMELQSNRTQSERTSVLEQMFAGDARSQLAALDAVSEIGYSGIFREPLRNLLLSALASPSVDVRRDGAIHLGEVGDDAALPHLIEALRDRSLAVRSAAASSLGSISGRDGHGVGSESNPTEVYLNWREWYRGAYGSYIQSASNLGGELFNRIANLSPAPVVFEFCSDCSDSELIESLRSAPLLENADSLFIPGFALEDRGDVLVFRDERTNLGSPLDEEIGAIEFSGKVREFISESNGRSSVSSQSHRSASGDALVEIKLENDATLREAYIQAARSTGFDIVIQYARWTDSSPVDKAQRVIMGDNEVVIDGRYVISYGLLDPADRAEPATKPDRPKAESTQ